MAALAATCREYAISASPPACEMAKCEFNKSRALHASEKRTIEVKQTPSVYAAGASDPINNL